MLNNEQVFHCVLVVSNDNINVFVRIFQNTKVVFFDVYLHTCYDIYTFLTRLLIYFHCCLEGKVSYLWVKHIWIHIVIYLNTINRQTLRIYHLIISLNHMTMYLNFCLSIIAYNQQWRNKFFARFICFRVYVNF